jgi:phenylacetate-CoA ligase
MNRAENMLMMSSYHLSDNTAAEYIRALKDFAPAIIQAYPSSISFLAKFLRSAGWFYDSKTLSGIVTSSETLTDADRQLIESRFSCKVYDWYGAFERVAAIGTCEESSYHLLSDYSFVEFSPVGNGQFEIIGTGFNNFLMPLIRFRTGDLVELSEQEGLCKCGRSFPIVQSILGREDDYIKLSDGRRVGRMDHIFKGLTGIAEAQIVQDEPDCIRILVVPFGEFSAVNRQSLLENVRQRLGPNIGAKVEIVTHIPRTGNGKFRSVVCNI